MLELERDGKKEAANERVVGEVFFTFTVKAPSTYRLFRCGALSALEMGVHTVLCYMTTMPHVLH